MKKDDVVRLAQLAGWDVNHAVFDTRIKRIAEMAYAAGAADDREECAKFIEEEYERQFEEPWRHNLAKAIRARGQK